MTTEEYRQLIATAGSLDELHNIVKRYNEERKLREKE